MQKKQFIYSDLSTKQLERLKEFFIQQKVDSMSNKELKRLAFEIIGHQITETIGKEEETEAWNEMSDFFGEKFGNIILEIQQKYNDNRDLKDDDEDPQKLRKELLSMKVTKEEEEEKKDMWND